MMATAPVADSLLSSFQVSVGFAFGHDTVKATIEATERTASECLPDLVLLVTAGAVTGDPVAAIRAKLGPAQIAGGATSALLTDEGPIHEGALVICVTNLARATSGVATVGGPTLAQAGQGAGRLILAGWPFRHHYPRGFGIAFARSGAGAPAQEFLLAWRPLMGPKMRTVCCVLPSPVLYGGSRPDATASVGCVAGPYPIGLGYAEGFVEGDRAPNPDALVQGAAEATITAIKRLEEHPARLVLVIASAARHRALGSAAADEWAAVRAEVPYGTPCVGWLSDDVAAYGRGVRAVDMPGSLVVATIGDPPEGTPALSTVAD